jgi:hypothetical protein
MSLLSSWTEKHSSSLLEGPMQACELVLQNNFGKNSATVRVNVQFICKHDQTMVASKSGGTHNDLRRTLLGVLLSTFVNQVWSYGNKGVNGFLWTPFGGNETKFIDINTVITKAINKTFSISGEQWQCHPSGHRLWMNRNEIQKKGIMQDEIDKDRPCPSRQ